MNDYSDLFYLLGAIVLYSILTLNVSTNLVINNRNLSESEVEYSGIALADGIIEQALWASKEELNSGSSEYMFDDYNKNNPKHEIIEMGPSNQYRIDFYIYAEVEDVVVNGSNTNNKKITVGVTSPFFYNDFDSTFSSYPIKLESIKSFKN